MRAALIAAVLLGGAVVAAAFAASQTDPAKLPLGDGKYTTDAPKRGYVYSCGPHTGGGGAQVEGPWIHGTGWDSTTKVRVAGTVRWSSKLKLAVVGSKLQVAGNGLPSHPTGVFPVKASDPAYQYDRNPNTIQAQSLSFSLPANPKVAARPSCFAGPIGIMLTGSVLFDALDGEGRDAPAHEVLDRCGGHPERTGQYHYHGLSPCADAGTSTTAHSKIVGYALDGFGIYGPRGEGGKLLSNADLDICHGHTHVITWRGKKVRMYHYHTTAEFPYSLNCFRGTSAVSGRP